VPDFTHLDVAPDRRILETYDDERTNVLFVGRLIPNKRPDNVIRYFRAYQALYDRPARLLLAGSYGGFDNYRAELLALTVAIGAENVEILGQVTNAELTALYDVADLFLCASEHEGFCVPLIEAFYKRVPVLAFAATAVPATMDGGGVLYTSTDPRVVAGLMQGVLTEEAAEEDILRRQDAALERLLARDFAGLVRRFVADALAGPRRGVVHAAPDFWDQFADAETLETIRLRRPAAFRALPRAPRDAARPVDLGHGR
jgi:glycosyltransferase involved in cell wall biosynthesis